MKFYVGISSLTHIKDVPKYFMFSTNRLLKRKSKINNLNKEWILDSGGYTQLLLNGKYTFTIDDYIKIITLQEPDYYVSMDWMCEPWMMEKTGKNIKHHLRKTIENHTKIKEIYDGNSKLMGVIQGYRKEDYLKCIDDLKAYGLIERYMGIGTLCRRQATEEAMEIISLIKSNLPSWVKLHGFGIKTLAFKKKQVLDMLYSADSHSWSFEGRRLCRRIVNEDGDCECDGEKCFSKAKNCANCGRYMKHWTLKIENMINFENL